MDTIIEIYDKEPILNTLASSVFKPDNVVFIGPRSAMNLRTKGQIRRYLSVRTPNTTPHFFEADIYDVSDVRRVMHEILDRFPEAMIDITGGSSTTLFAVGLFCKEHKVPVFAYNRKHNVFYNVYHCEQMEDIPCDPRFTVEEILAMAGGMFLKNGHISGDAEDKRLFDEIEAVFKLFMRNTRRWNRFVQYLQATTSIEGKPLSITAPIRKQKRGSMLVCDEGLMHELEKIGMIEDLRFKGDRVSYRFRSMTVRQCLNDIGVWLELYVYKTARDCGGFDDARISVVVDWNAVEDEAYNTINELDVVLTYGVRPVFISCKSGIPNTTALNEIKMLTNLFGGSHAKGVLATMCDLKKEAPAAYQRALDMGIGVIDKDDFTSGMLAERLLAVAKQ